MLLRYVPFLCVSIEVVIGLVLLDIVNQQLDFVPFLIFDRVTESHWFLETAITCVTGIFPRCKTLVCLIELVLKRMTVPVSAHDALE